ncbi:MAG: hypothetical protein KHZ90_09680 [Veillonella parvula]|uniref:Uncharacterized protein n=1 Tax=Veillonella parvula TaxID=29466 RepID=A0A943A3Y5_VEIPA|nr:hypothetical protein [Veillonella parvula]MBS4894025.1 hypothetical protein [Veillonella parvula]
MMKVLTIIFLIYYISNLFSPYGIISRNTGDFLEAHSKDEGFLRQSVKLLGLFLIMFLFGIIEMIYVVLATNYGSKIITISFLIFYIINLIISYKKNKKSNSKDEEAIEFLNKFKNNVAKRTVRGTIVTIITIIYFVYMFTVLFF